MVKRLDVVEVSYSESEGDLTEQTLKTCSFNLESTDLCYVSSYPEHADRFLLDLVAQRSDGGSGGSGKWSGCIWVNGNVVDGPCNEIMYLDGHLHFEPHLSVRETLLHGMAQRGYLDPRACGESARAILQETNMVALGENQVHTLTVNQKLRLGIALKSLPGTQVLVVNDDFTRGLEADAVLEIMLTLRRRARSGIAVLVRLMQPTTDLFALFDKALFLSCGRVAYFGPADETNVYFTRPELDYAYHEGENPADFAFDICSGQIFPKGWTHKRSGENLYSLYIESEYAFRFPESRAQAQAAEQQSAMQSGMSGEPWPLRDSFRYLALEFGKRWRLALRDPRSRLMLLATPIAAGLLLGIACLRAAMTSVDDSLVMWGPDGSYHFLAPGATVSSNIFYFCIVASSLANILHIEDVQRRQSIFLQDLAGRKSSPLAAHCLVCVLAPLPYLLARCLLVLALLYPMAGLPSSGGAFFTTLVFSFLSAASSHYYLLLLAACNLDKSSPSEAKAQNLLAAFVTPLTLIASLGGCFNSARDVAVYYRWFYEPVMVQAWSTYNEPALPSTNGSVPLPSSTASSDFVLSTYGMQENSVVMNVSLLFMAMLILVLLLYAIMLASPPGAKKLESAEYASEVRGGREGHTSKSGRADAKPSRLGAPKINRRVGYSKLLDDSTVRSDAEVVSSGDPGQTRSHRSSLASSSSDGDVEANEPRSRRSSSYTAPEGEIRTVEYFRENSRDVNPIKGVRLVFRHLSFSVSSSSNENDQKYLLRNVSGRANPGEVCGILGPTNSGKNTLMRLLAGLALSEGGEIAGDILFDGVERTPSVTRSTAFVAGSTQLIPMLTVREFVSYAAQLKVPKASTQKLIDRRVQKVLRVAGLAEQADTIIGEVARAGGRRRARLLGCWADALTPRQSPSLTGRERMRLSLAMEVVAFPDLLFVDMEAAAGVDRIAQLEMMSCIRNISSATRATTLLTLDRPSRAVFGMLDKLVLLAEGRVLYFGPARDSPKFFTTSPFQFPCAPGISPSDFLLGVAQGTVPSSKGKSVSARDLATFFAGSDLSHMFMENIDTMIALDLEAVGNQALLSSAHKMGRYPTSMQFQLRVLIARQISSRMKNPLYAASKTIRGFVFGVLVGLMYRGLGSDGVSTHAYTDRLGILFVMLAFVWLDNLFACADRYALHLCHAHDRRARLCHGICTWIASWALDAAAVPMDVALLSLPAYSIAGLNASPGARGTYFGALMMASYCALFLSLLTVVLSSSRRVAAQAYAAVVLLFVLFGGYIVWLSRFNDYIRNTLPNLSVFRYSYQALVQNELNDNTRVPAGYEYVQQMGFAGIPAAACVSTTFSFLLCLVGATAVLDLFYTSKKISRSPATNHQST